MVHSSKAPLALIKVGNPFVGRLRTIVMPFDHADVNAHNSLFPWSLYYLENPVYPFRPNSIYKDHDQWIRNEARDTGILVALDKTPFDIRLSGGRWIFPEVELEEASKNDLEKGECIICCAKSSDMSTGRHAFLPFHFFGEILFSYAALMPSSALEIWTIPGYRCATR